MRKIIAALLVLMMVFSLAACGGKDDPTPSGDDTPDIFQQEETPDPGEDTPDDADTPDSSETPPDDDAGTLFGWTEDDFKPDDIFADMTYEEGMGYFISTTEPLGAEGFKAWYHKLAAKIEALADDGTYTIANVTDLDEYLAQAVDAYESKTGSSMYLMWEYTSGGQKIGITTMVVDLERTEEVLYFYIHESNT